MSLHWFKPPPPSSDDFDTQLDHLYSLGVRWEGDWAQAPSVTYSFRDCELVAEVGALTVGTESGLIRIWPFRGIGVREGRVLACTAQLAFEQKPSKARGWSYVRRGIPRWVTYILVPVKDGDQMGRLIAAHQEAMKFAPMRALDRAIEREVTDA